MKTIKTLLIMTSLSFITPSFALTTTDDVCMSHCACAGVLYDQCYDRCTVDDHVYDYGECKHNSW